MKIIVVEGMVTMSAGLGMLNVKDVVLRNHRYSCEYHHR